MPKIDQPSPKSHDRGSSDPYAPWQRKQAATVHVADPLANVRCVRSPCAVTLHIRCQNAPRDSDDQLDFNLLGP